MSKEKRAAAADPRWRVTAAVPLPFGRACAVLYSDRLYSVEWEESAGRLTEVVAKRFPGSAVVPGEATDVGRLLLDYAAGKRVTVSDILSLPVAWDRVPGFRRDVLRETARIPYGETATYGEIAARIGSPRAARAVGASLHLNPWPVIVPCHRVVGSGGRLVGFGKGLPAKEALLRFEGAA